MKHDPSIVAASTQESSPFYDDIVLERGNYRISVGKDTAQRKVVPSLASTRR